MIQIFEKKIVLLYGVQYGHLPHRFKEMTSSFASSGNDSLSAASRAGFQSVLSLAALVAGRRGAQAAFSDLPQPATVAAAAADALGACRHPFTPLYAQSCSC